MTIFHTYRHTAKWIYPDFSPKKNVFSSVTIFHTYRHAPLKGNVNPCVTIYRHTAKWIYPDFSPKKKQRIFFSDDISYISSHPPKKQRKSFCDDISSHSKMNLSWLSLKKTAFLFLFSRFGSSEPPGKRGRERGRPKKGGWVCFTLRGVKRHAYWCFRARELTF